MTRQRSRYLGILRGRNTTARDQLIGYLTGERNVNYPSRSGNRPPMQRVFVKLFGFELPAATLLVQKVNSQRWESVKDFFNLYTKEALATEGTAEVPLEVRGIRAPRVVVTTGRSGTGTSQTSELTGLPYKSYGGTSVSVPYGPATSSNTEIGVYQIIRGRVLADSPEDSPPNTAVYVPGSIS